MRRSYFGQYYAKQALTGLGVNVWSLRCFTDQFENFGHWIHMHCAYLSRKCKGKKLMGRPRRKWENNIGKDLEEIEYERIYWIELKQNKVR